MKVDVIIPVYNNLKLTRMCIDSLRIKDKDYRLIIINNGSNKITKSYLKSLNAKIIENKVNIGYIKAVNQGLMISKSSVKLLLNNDVITTFSFLENLKNKIKYGFDIVGPLTNMIDKKNNKLENQQLIKPKYKYISGLNKFSRKLIKSNKDRYIETKYVYGHCMLITRKCYEKIGLFDDSYGLGNYEDVDYCNRARNNGLKIAIALDSYVHHFCHKTFELLKIDVNKLIERNEIIFKKRWEV